MRNNIFTFLLLSFLFFFPAILFAQSHESDSLKKLLLNKVADSTRVSLLNALSKSYFKDNPDTSVKIAFAAKQLAEKIGFQIGLSLALKQMGIGYYMQGKYIDAIKNWQQALEVYKVTGDKLGVANMLSNQGAV